MPTRNAPLGVWLKVAEASGGAAVVGLQAHVNDMVWTVVPNDEQPTAGTVGFSLTRGEPRSIALEDGDDLLVKAVVKTGLFEVLGVASEGF